MLDPQTKKRVEILIQTVKRLEPEEIAMKIKHFDQEVCTEVFLSELKPVLPNPEQVFAPFVLHADFTERGLCRSASSMSTGMRTQRNLLVSTLQIDSWCSS